MRRSALKVGIEASDTLHLAALMRQRSGRAPGRLSLRPVKPFVRDAPEPRSPEDLAALQERLERLLDRALRDGAAAEQGTEQSAEVRAEAWEEVWQLVANAKMERP